MGYSRNQDINDLFPSEFIVGEDQWKEITTQYDKSNKSTEDWYFT